MDRKDRQSKKFLSYFKSCVVFRFNKFTNLPNDLLCIVLALFTLNDFTQSLLDHLCDDRNCFSCQVKNMLVSFRNNQGEQDSSIILNKLSAFSSFSEKFGEFFEELHKSSKDIIGFKCNCCVHKHFVHFIIENSCNCGYFSGNLLGIKGKILELPASQFVYPESSQKELFDTYSLYSLKPSDLIKLGKNSVLLKIHQKFIEAFQSTIKAPSPNSPQCCNPSCSPNQSSLLTKRKASNNLIISFNYNSTHISLFNSMQILSQIKSPLPSNLLPINSSDPFYISTIIFTNFTNNSVFSIRDSRWFELKQNSQNLIGKGLWADIAIHALKEKLFPLLIIYSKTHPSECKLSNFQLILLEAISYSLDFFEDASLMQNLIFHHDTFYNDRLEIVENCPFCGLKRNILETCSGCGFYESDWECGICGFYNFMDNKVCCNCEIVRINIGQDYSCAKCKLVSFGSKSCIYCPYCCCKKCNRRVSPYTSLYCRNCKSLTGGNKECIKSHTIWCYLCYQQG